MVRGISRVKLSVSVEGSIFRKFLFLWVVFHCSCSPSYILVKTLSGIHSNESFDWSIVDGIPVSYECYTQDRIVNVNFRFINTADTLFGFDQESVLSVAKILISEVNRRLRNNAKMHLPVGNNTPNLDAHIQLRLEESDVSIHYDKDPFFRKKGRKSNQYNRDIINRYVAGSGDQLNVFIMPFDPDEIASGIQRFDKSGIALGNSIKLAGIMESGNPAWDYGGLLMHELGHVLGLRHSWNNNDGCEDTPRHANCWSNTGEPPCDQIESNNFMDYNTHQSAITPCQIRRMHVNMATQGTKQHRLLEVNWCERLEGEIVINNQQHWADPVFISKDIVIAKEGILVVSSKLSMAKNTKITVLKGGRLLLDGARVYNYCRDPWDGIFVHPKGLITSRKNSIVEDLKSSKLYSNQ